MQMNFKWNRPISEIEYQSSGGDQGRLFLANTAKRMMDPYVPALNLILAQNVRVYVEDQRGMVQYNSPYAHYQYEGILYVSSLTGSPWASHGEHKVSTNRTLIYGKTKHPLATSHWDKAMMAARKSDLVRSYQRWLKGSSV